MGNKTATESQAGTPKTPKRKWPKRLAIATAGVAVTACIAFLAYTSDYYHAGDTAVELSETLASSGSLRETDNCIAIGNTDAETGIVLYPGAKVDPLSYVPLAQELAECGYYCAIAKMPFNLAGFNVGAAQDIMDAVPSVDRWWIGGHSLGGAMAAQFASEHANELDGVLLLAAYAACDLSGSGLSVDIIYGSNDGVLNRKSLTENAVNLPAGSETNVIEGGNHAGFGDYGPQDGDGSSSIGASAQWEQTAELTSEAIGRKGGAHA